MVKYLNQLVKKRILEVLDQSIKAIKKNDVMKLRDLSNYTIHSASLSQDSESILTAVIVYALFKIIERHPDSEPEIVDLLVKARKQLLYDNLKEYNKLIKRLMRLVSRKDKKLSLYVRKVLEESNIKKGSRIYEHGISLAQAADILGVSQWELMSYVGKTKIHDFSFEEIKVKNRIDYARKVFNLG